MKKHTGKRIENQGIFLRNIYQGISELIVEDHPEYTGDTVIAGEDLNNYRKKYIESMLRKEKEFAIINLFCF